jgi:preprotein translocase subunit Sec63
MDTQFDNMEYELSVEALWYRIEILLCDIANDEDLSGDLKKKLVNAKMEQYISELRERVENYKDIGEMEESNTEEDSENDESDDSEAVQSFQSSLQLRKDLKWLFMDLSARYQNVCMISKESLEETRKQIHNVRVEKEKENEISNFGRVIPALIVGGLLFVFFPISACYLKKILP